MRFTYLGPLRSGGVPIVNAGSDQVVQFPMPINLAGSAFDDGQPVLSPPRGRWSAAPAP